MITKSKQDWEIGKEVRVGFLSLTVVDAKKTPKDGYPDAYLLTNGKKFYAFTPHNGLYTVKSPEEFYQDFCVDHYK